MPYDIRDKMRFERESEGIYKYGKKRVFMKIEKDQIIIRVGGGYLTIEEFIEQYCDTNTGSNTATADSTRRRLFGLIYGGNCHGSKDFKTFYFTQKTLVNNNENNNMMGANNKTELMPHEDNQNSSSNACINIKDIGLGDSTKHHHHQQLQYDDGSR
jgi:Growth-Arrest-Specific Protein 2 Domain